MKIWKLLFSKTVAKHLNILGAFQKRKNNCPPPPENVHVPNTRIRLNDELLENFDFKDTAEVAEMNSLKLFKTIWEYF